MIDAANLQAAKMKSAIAGSSTLIVYEARRKI
jgi:hypothetical protein